MYSDAFCKVYHVFGWNYYPEAFGEQLLQWLQEKQLQPNRALDLACGTGVLCRILHGSGIEAAGMDVSAGMIGIARQEDPRITYEVADMVTYRPDRKFDLVTCTGDALNHIPALSDVGQIFRNVYDCLTPGGMFVFDLLNEREISTDEPFDLEYSETTRAQLQMVRPTPEQVELQIRVYENGVLQFEEKIRETVHDLSAVCGLLRDCGFTVTQCADRLLEHGDNHGTTWFIAARK